MSEHVRTGAKILVVDDSAVDRTLAGSLVEQAGWSVVYAEDGEQALQEIDKESPNAILTDLRMPKVDGLQLVERVRHLHPHIPVILMTGVGSEEIAAKALNAGAASYVPKQSLGVDLEEALSQVLMILHHGEEVSLGKLFRQQESHFELGYEKNGLETLVNHSQQCLAQLDFGDEAELIRVGMALTEALNNAVDHGNLELDSTLREEADGRYDQLRKERLLTLPYRDRRVYLTQKLTSQEAVFVVKDEGAGFDPTQLPDPTDPENLMRASGRGMLLIRTFMDEVKFNEAGNEITLVKKRRQPPAQASNHGDS